MPGASHAGQAHDCKGEEGSAGGEIGLHPGRRVRARGNSQDTPWRARSALDQTGDRDRLVRGAASGRRPAPAGARKSQAANAPQRRVRLSGRTRKAKDAAAAAGLARGEARARARATELRLAPLPFAPGEACRIPPQRRVPLGGRPQGGAHKGPGRPRRSRAQSRSDPRAQSQGGKAAPRVTSDSPLQRASRRL
jgi:hypothetical protein